MRFYWERVEAARNFANKIWNASRFIMMNMEGVELSAAADAEPEDADKWILSKFNDLAKEVTENMDKYELGIALQKIYDFIWEEFCDWYIEMVKPRFREGSEASRAAACRTLKEVLIGSLKLLHPYMPFITEEIFCNLQDEEESIMISDWPVFREDRSFTETEKQVELIKEAVRAIRNLRVSMNVPPSKKARVFVTSADEEIRKVYTANAHFFAVLASASDVVVQADKTGISENAVSAVTTGAVLYIPMEELVDMAKERERLEKEAKRLQGEIARSGGMLNNERFLSKAPEAKVQEEKEKLMKYTLMLDQVKEQLSKM